MSLDIEYQASLQRYNTLAVPATADAMVTVSSVEELQAAIALSKRQLRPYLMLGDGSNTVFVNDFPGLVIRNRLKGIQIVEEGENHVVVSVAAGENWHRFVARSVNQGWCGLENLALIPGTVGAAPIQNIGAYGVELESLLVELLVFDIASSRIESISPQACGFAYRDSYFKHQWRDTKVIIEVVFKLHKDAEKVNIAYPALKDFSPPLRNVKNVFEAVCEIRRRKLPDPSALPNAGSFFKNPLVSKVEFERLKRQYPEIVAYPVNNEVKLAAAWLIEQCGWKQRSVKGVRVHQQQALVVINPERREGEAVLALAQAIQAQVQDMFLVELEIEPRLVNGDSQNA